MAYTQLTLGLTLTIPTAGTRNWGPTMQSTTWTKISQHAHTGSGDGAQLGTSAITDFAITKDKLAKTVGVFQKVSTLAPAGTTQTVDFTEGSIQKLDLGAASGNVTVTLSNAVAGVKYKLFVIQAASAKDIVWPASVKWANGQAPLLSSTEDAIDIIELYFDGTNFFGDWDLGYA